MTEAVAARGADRVDRNLALLNYGLLFASLFFAGIPGLVAVILAYAERDEAPQRVKSHLTFQIRIFWVAFATTMVAAAATLGAVLLTVAGAVNVGVREDRGGFAVDMAHLHVAGPVVALSVAAAVFSVITIVWLIIAPAVGFIRLASDRAISESLF